MSTLICRCGRPITPRSRTHRSRVCATCLYPTAFAKYQAEQDQAAMLQPILDGAYGDLGVPTVKPEFVDVLGAGPFLPDDED